MRLKIVLTAPPRFSTFYAARIRKAVFLTIESLPTALKKKFRKHKQSFFVSVTLVGIPTITTLNKKYRGKNKATDVLSFSSLETGIPGTPEACVGDLVICLPVAKKQALLYGESLGRELERLAVHGTLHLFGYDHEKSKKDEQIMFRKQDAVLMKLSPKHLKT